MNIILIKTLSLKKIEHTGWVLNILDSFSHDGEEYPVHQQQRPIKWFY